MQLSDETMQQLIGVALQQMLNTQTSSKSNNNHPWEIGQNYCIRTVTMIQTGKLVSVSEQELVLEDAAWIADTARFHDFLKDPAKASEVEPFPNKVIIGRGSVIDASTIESLPREQK